MGISRINNNITGQAQNSLNSLNQLIQRNFERLASGSRINRAGDDAAGLRIANQLQTNLLSLNEAVNNAQNGINLINTGDQALGGVSDSLSRIRELAIQAGNTGVNDPQAIQAIQSEINQQISEIGRVANTTQFNQQQLFNGDLAPTAGVRPGTTDPGVNIDNSNLTTTQNFLSITQTQAQSAAIVGGDAPGGPQTINTGIRNATDIAVSTGRFFNTAGNTAAAAGDALTNLSFNNGQVQNGGTIAFRGVLSDGRTEFSGSIQVSALTDLAGGNGASTSFADAIQASINQAEQDAGIDSVAGTNAGETNVGFDAATGRLQFSGATEGVSNFNIDFTVVDASGDVQNQSGATRAQNIGGQATGAQIGNSVTAITGSTFESGDLQIEVSNVIAAQQRTVESSGFLDTGGGAANASSNLIGSVFNGVTLAQGDTIAIGGTNADGTTFSNTITISTVDGSAGNGAAVTFQDLIDELNVRDQTQAAGGLGNQSGFTDATAQLTSGGQIQVTDDIAGASQTNFTLTVNDNSSGGGTFGTVAEQAALTQEGFAQSASVSVNGGEAQRVTAGQTVTLTGSDANGGQGQVTFTAGENLSNGTDTIQNQRAEFTGALNGGPQVRFAAGEQDVRFVSGNRPGESLTLDFDQTVDVPGVGAANSTTVVISATGRQANFQIGAQAGQQLGVSFGDIRPGSLGLGDGRSVADINVTQEGGVDEALSIIDQALSQVDSLRGTLGAASNRLTATTDNLSVASENLLAARSRISDANFASESTRNATNELLLRFNIGVQSQANNLFNSIFSDLLR